MIKQRAAAVVIVMENPLTSTKVVDVVVRSPAVLVTV
jgi:hypothetical protein